MKIKNSNLTINVKDLDKSIQFYESIGFAIKEKWGNHYAQMVAPGILIGLHPTKSSNLQGSSVGLSIGFTTDDFEGTKNELHTLGITVTKRTEEGGDFLHFNDPDGTPLYFIQSKW